MLPRALLITGALIASLCTVTLSQTKTDSTKTKTKEVVQKILENLKFTADVRLRVEHDWDSMKADSTMRDDRTRFRFRLRFGAKYAYKWASLGFRIRTGNLNDQQGPHVTLGGGTGEFSNIQLGFEKVYFQAQHKWFKMWLGKNTFPFQKQNELFWNDNVYPEGIAIRTSHKFNSKIASGLDVNLGHFIVNSNGKYLDTDRFFQGYQLVGEFWEDRIKVFPSFYYFNKLQDIPDGKGTYDVEYSIFHTGAEVTVRKANPRIKLGADYYNNLSDLKSNDSIPSNLRNQNQGAVASVKIGDLKKKHGWTVELYYAFMQRYAVVDYFAQNDWARWDYSGADATGTRLTNSQGAEIRLGYSPLKNLTFIFRGYYLQQLIRQGIALEDGYRVRLDLNFGF